MPPGSSLFLMSLLCATGFTAPNVRHFVSRTNATRHGPFGNNVLWSSNTRTVRECAVLCAADMRCSAFTLLRDSSEAGQLCLGHSDDAADRTQGDVTAIRAAVFFQTTWVGTACVSDSDCSQLQDDTSCFHDTCVCTPGFFYSISSDTCVTECPPGKLAPSYTKYENHSLPARNDMQRASSLLGCFDLCNASPTCLSIDFHKSPTATKNCYISYSMAEGPNQLDSALHGNLDYYQRQCQ